MATAVKKRAKRPACHWRPSRQRARGRARPQTLARVKNTVSIALELRWAFGLEGGNSFTMVLGACRHAHRASDRLERGQEVHAQALIDRLLGQTDRDARTVGEALGEGIRLVHQLFIVEHFGEQADPLSFLSADKIAAPEQF